ncbi:MotE family protein [Pontibacillus salicampi]|uniref:MotE family protein n=1 Tax=Pontibacillus salicampi TaxID=1449801 RepID=A0ABV6LP03_9BACI
MAGKEVQDRKKTSKFQWFVFGILIPLVFAITVALIVMTIGGVNVFEKVQQYGSNIPGVSAIVSSEQDSGEEESDSTRTSSAELQATIQDQNAQITQLQDTIASKDSTIEELNNEIATLTEQINKESKNNDNQKEVMKDVSSSFKDMDADKAAPIITELDKSVALSILQEIPDKERGKIFEEMDPKTAASLTSALVQRN